MATSEIIKCNLCNSEAIAIFYFNYGCYCDITQNQPLCLHHAFKSGPGIAGGCMELVEDLTIDKSFTHYWKNKNEG